MCVHYWILDSSDKGVCKKCGIVKDFAPKIEITIREKRVIYHSFNDVFYRQGKIWLDELDVQ